VDGRERKLFLDAKKGKKLGEKEVTGGGKRRGQKSAAMHDGSRKWGRGGMHSRYCGETYNLLYTTPSVRRPCKDTKKRLEKRFTRMH